MGVAGLPVNKIGAGLAAMGGRLVDLAVLRRKPPPQERLQALESCQCETTQSTGQPVWAQGWESTCFGQVAPPNLEDWTILRWLWSRAFCPQEAAQPFL